MTTVNLDPARTRILLLAVLMLLTLGVTGAIAAEPATPQAAARVLDLRTFPRPNGAAESSLRTLGMLMYESPVSAAAAFDFQQQQLTKAGWKVQPGAYHDANNHSAQFNKQGYSLAVSTSSVMGEPDKQGWSRMALINHGNVQAANLPVPKGVKPFGSYGGDASYLSDAKVADAASACRKLLTSAGWTPYGSAGSDDAPMMYFKKNAIRVMAWISTAPAQGNKTMIRYSTELLSADLPVPPNAPDPRYNDTDKSLSFDFPGEDSLPVIAFYQEALPKLGWQATTDKPIRDDGKRTEFLIFRNSDRDMISLDLEHFNEIVRVKVEYDTAAEVQEEERLAKEAARKKLAEREAARLAGDDKPTQPKLPAGVEIPELPDTDDVGGLLKAAQKMADDAIGEARQAVKEAGGAPQKPAAPAGPARVADIAMPDGAGVEYNNIVKMIKVTSADDVATLAKFFLDSLPAGGWAAAPNPLVTDDSAILKFTRGEATLTIMAGGEDSGSEATLICKGVNWDQVPPSRAAAKTPAKVASSDNKAELPAADHSADDEPKPIKLKYAAKVSAAEQKQTGATIEAGGKKFALAYGVAYQAVDDGQQKTEVLLSTKPINVDKLVALLNNGQDGGDAISFEPQLKLRYDAEGKLSYLFLYADGLSVNLSGQGEDKIESQLTIDGDRARGKTRLVQPGKLFDNEYTFTAPFDVKRITGTAPSGNANPAEPPEALAGEDFNGLPVPLITTNRSSTGSPFRNTIEVSIPAPLAAVVDFYRTALAKSGWKEDARAAKLTGDGATLAFTSSEGTLSVGLTRQDDKTQATLAARFPAKAQAAGIAPQAGKGRLILGNAGDREVVIVINGQQYKVAAGKGAQNPKDGVSLHVLPGNYNVSIKSAGQQDKSEKLKIAVGETWGVIVLPTGGYFADQVY